jgi:hypothetical protein
MNHLSMGNSITSLRLCATLDWNEYVEGVSLIEQILQRDPPGVYGRMEVHEPRSLPPRGRGAVRSHRRGPGEVALRAIESARQEAEKAGTRIQNRARGLPPDRGAAAASWRAMSPTIARCGIA